MTDLRRLTDGPRRTLLLPLLLAAFLLGCDSTGSSPPGLEGEYGLQKTVEEMTFTFDLSLSEEDGQISGTGTLVGEDSSMTRSFDLSVSGTHDHPDARLLMTTEEEGTTTILEGTVSEDGSRVEGTLTFPDGTETEATLREK